MWFKFLPALSFWAKVYKLDSPVFKHQGFVGGVALINCTSVILAELMLTFILPSVYFGDPGVRAVLDELSVYFRTIFAAVCTFFMNYYLITVRR